jgi:hypothetical protein
MHYPKFLSKCAARSDLVLGLVAASVVLLSGLVMGKLSVGPANFATLSLPSFAQAGAPDLVTQNAIAPEASPTVPAIAASACPISLEVMDEGGAMIGGTLLAPCLPNQDLVIAHAGMVFSAKTLSTGALFFSLPALKTDGKVDIRFTDGETASASVPMPDAAAVQRVAVQWPYEDGFVIHAFENGAAFGAAGHIWQEAPNLPAAGASATGGYVQLLGDGAVAMPLLAQVFTYDPATPTEVLFEAAVTQTNCAGEMMGDVLFSKGGAVEKSEMTVAMPDCDAVGEYVHLGFVPPNPALALAN